MHYRVVEQPSGAEEKEYLVQHRAQEGDEWVEDYCLGSKAVAVKLMESLVSPTIVAEATTSDY